MVKLTVALPVFNSRDIAWLSMESLCRQQGIKFQWELIVCEEQNDHCAGKEFFHSYFPRLQKVGCQYIKYIPLKQWIPLAQKWRMIGQLSSKSSIVFVLQAADCYSHPKRLVRTFDTLKTKKYSWYQCIKGYFYNIFTDKVIIYDHTLHGPHHTRLTALNMATLTVYARSLPKSDKKKGVDGWFLSTIPHPRIYHDTDKSWATGADTQGMNNISKKRAGYFEDVRPPFKASRAVISKVLPSDIVTMLKQTREKVLKVVPETQNLAALRCIADVNEKIPLSFVYVWVQKLSVWNELSSSIRSIRKFYQGEYRVFVVGDNPNIKGVTHIPADRIVGFAYCRSHDITNKLKVIISRPEISDNFIYMYDDIIFLKPVSLEILKKAIAIDLVEDYEKYFREGVGVQPSQKWKTLFHQTMYQLVKRKLPTYNYETHLPRVLNKQRLKYIIERFDLNENPYLFSTLYFNTFYEKPDIELRKNFHIKAGVYRPYDNPKSLDREINGKLFLNYDDRGLNNLLKKKILDIIRP